MKNVSRIRNRLPRYILLAIYYGFAQYIPAFGILRKVGKKSRYFICRPLFARIGTNVGISSKVNFGSGENIEIGDNSGLGRNCWIRNAKIGRCVLMGPDFLYISRNHAFDRTDMPMKQQGKTELRQLTIEDDVWIGARVIALPGIKIGRGAIVGAGSVLTKDVPPFSIVGGNPARVIRTRNQ
jgi:maltose O-acetyltransferase